MANITRGKTFNSGDTVYPADLHQLVDNATVTGIVNADIDGGAAIAGGKLADLGVTTAKIADTAVTAAKLAADAVETAKIKDANVTAAKLASASVTAAKLDGAQTGSAPIYGCRAWVNFDGQTDSTGNSNTNNTNRQILGSGNVSSVTKTGQGAFTVNFTTAMGGSNYAAVITHHSTTSGSALTRFVAKNSSDFQFITTDAGGTASNARFVNVLIFE